MISRALKRRHLLKTREVFDDVLVVPYQQLLNRPLGGQDHQGGPIWPQWEKQTTARFNRDGQPVDQAPEPVTGSQRINGKDYVWIGPVHPHFGHGLAEFLTRLACSIHGLRKPKLVFSSRAAKPIESLDAAPAWFRGVLDWYSVDPADVIFITRPTEFERLWVYPQPEQLHHLGPTDAYLDLMDEISTSNFARLGVIPFCQTVPAYVSRAGTQSGFAGEAYLEKFLTGLGVAVFRPEQHSISEQMQFYCSHRQLIFAEGSALHGTQLLGRCLGNVTVLSRRGSHTGEPFCQAFVQPRAKSLQYVDCVRGLIHGDNKLGRPALATAISLIDQERLLLWLQSIGIETESSWDAEDFRQSETEAIRRWLAFINRRPNLRSQASSIYRSLEEQGFSSLMPEAESLFNN